MCRCDSNLTVGIVRIQAEMISRYFQWNLETLRTGHIGDPSNKEGYTSFSRFENVNQALSLAARQINWFSLQM